MHVRLFGIRALTFHSLRCEGLYGIRRYMKTGLTTRIVFSFTALKLRDAWLGSHFLKKRRLLSSLSKW